MVSSMFEGYDDDYFSSFELEDIPEMIPGSDAHKAFMDDLRDDPSASDYKEPSEEELNRMIQSLRYANLDLPSDQELIAQARKKLKRELNNSEIEAVKRTKQRMEKLAGKGSFNESINVKENVADMFRDPRQIAMARKLMGDDSIIVLNKLDLGEELTFREEDEAREKYFTDYFLKKASLSKGKQKINPINTLDLEYLFEKGDVLLNQYLNILIEKYSNVEQVPPLERASLLNDKSKNIPFNSSNEIAKKYLIKMFLNINVPQAGDNKWTFEDCIEAQKAYQIAMTDDAFMDKLEKILAQKGKKNSNLYKKLKEKMKNVELIDFIREEVSKLQKLDILKEEKIRIKKDLKKLNEGFFKDLWNDATLKTEKDKLRKTDNYNYLYKNLSSTSIRIAGSLNKLLSYSKQDIINIAETMFDDKFEDLALQNPKLLKIVIDDLYEFVHSQKDSENLDEGFFKDLWDDVTSKKEKEELKKIQLRKTDDYKYLYNNLRSVCTKISPDKLAFYTKQDISNMAKIMSDGKFKELALQKPNLLNLVIDDLYNVFHS